MRSRLGSPSQPSCQGARYVCTVDTPARDWLRCASLIGVIAIFTLALVACASRQADTTPEVVTTAGEAVVSGDPVWLDEDSPLLAAPDQPVTFQQVSLEQGLSQSSVFCMLQDRAGFMWFGTQDGLNRYDGYQFTVFRPVPGEPNSLSSSYVLALHQDRDDILWIGTNGGGLNSLDPATGVITRHTGDAGTLRNLQGGIVYTILQDREGILWVGTDQGLNRLDPGRTQFRFYEPEDDQPTSPGAGGVRVLFEARDRTLWIGTLGGGLSQLDREHDQFVHYHHNSTNPHSLSGKIVTSIYQDAEDRLWIGTEDGGLSRLDPSTGRFSQYRHEPEKPNSLSSNVVRAIHGDRYGRLWIGTAGKGIDRLDPVKEQFTHFLHDPADPESLSDDWIWSLQTDQSGLLWIGTLGGGANIVGCAGQSFAHYQASRRDADGLSGNFVWSLYEDREGALWIGTFGYGLDKFDREIGRWYHYRHDPQDPNSLSSDVVRGIAQDPEGTLWIGTEGGGLNRLDPTSGHFIHYRRDDSDASSLRSDDLYTVYVDQSGSIWVGTRQGSDRLDRATGRFSHLDLDGTPVRAIYQDRGGILWLGTDLDLYSLDLQTRDWREAELDGSVLSIREDRDGDLWIGTFGHGLARMDRTSETFREYRQEDGLPSDVVYGVLEDADGHLWLSTNAGISEFDPETERFVNFDESDGIQSKEFNAGAYFGSSSGEMFFGGVHGFNTFFPDQLTTNLYRPPIVLTALTQGGVDTVGEDALRSMKEAVFKWPNNFFEFEFAALNYCQPESNEYAYMLEGLDRGWLYVGSQRTGRYTNLPGRTYTLRAKGSNNDGIWNEEGISLTIKVVPPFWATWWFRGGAAVAVLAAAVVGFRLRVRSLQVRSKELETLVEERTRALADRTRETERRKQELEALYRADAELHRHLDLDQVLSTLMDIAVDILGADKSSLMVWDGYHERLVVRVAQGYHPETLRRMVFTPSEGTVGHVATTGQPAAVRDTATDPRVVKRAAITEPERIRSYMQVPIEVGGEIYGVFSADYVEPRAFGAEEKRLFLALAQRAARAIDNAQLHEQSQALAVTEERSRLARELHDAVTQTLFSSSLIAETVPELWETDPAEGRKLLQELRQLTRGALAEMRTLLLELRPAALVDTNLADLLRQLGDAATGRLGVPATVSADGQCSLPVDVHVALYRIAQEALNNVVKHSEATMVMVGLECQTEADPSSDTPSGSVVLQVMDNGRGFDLEQVPANRLGLGIIRERAQAIGANLEIQSQPGVGTRIEARWSEGG